MSSKSNVTYLEFKIVGSVSTFDTSQYYLQTLQSLGPLFLQCFDTVGWVF